MPAGPVTIRFRHLARMIRDLFGHWHHNRGRWPVVLLVVIALAGLALLVG